MIKALLLLVLLSSTLADSGEPRRAASEKSPATFELKIRGVAGSDIDLRCTAIIGRPFTVRRELSKGKHAEVRGRLRLTDEGKYVLEVSIPETGFDGDGRVEFSTDVNLGEKGMVYLGWVRWYEVTVSRGK